jgi:hypothetical protein
MTWDVLSFNGVLPTIIFLLPKEGVRRSEGVIGTPSALTSIAWARQPTKLRAVCRSAVPPPSRILYGQFLIVLGL